MIKRNQTAMNRLNALVDFLLVLLSYLLATWVRFYVLDGARTNMALTRGMVLAAGVYALGLMTALAMLGFYSTTRTRQLSWKLQVLFLAMTLTVLLAGSLLYVFRLEEFSRGTLVIFYLLCLLLLGGKYVASRLMLNQLRAQGFNMKHEVVIGGGPLAKQYCEDVKLEPELGLQVEEVLAPSDAEGIARALANPAIDDAVIALEAQDYSYITELIAACEKNGVRYMVIPFYNDLMPAHPVIENVGRSKLINMRANRLQDIGWAALKRSLDILASGLGMLVLSPLLALIALGVKLSSPGPVLFKQVRVGYNRQEFQMLKFRSMRVNNRQDTAWSTVQDDRRTRFGAFIRKTSLDELPQLWNVFRGDMSLVGPRPELPHFVERFRETIPLYMVKHQVKPGITGWAQVNGYRGDTSIENRIRLDLWYIENWSLWLDLKILFMTFAGGMLNNERSGSDADQDVRVLVCARGPYWMPSDRMYLPVQVGARQAETLEYMPDDTGENISGKAGEYGALTALYWAWKNLRCEYLGLAHDRRHFSLRPRVSNRRDVLTLAEARQLVAAADVVLPKLDTFLLESNYNYYARVHHARDLDEARKILAEKYPTYLEAFDAAMASTKGHRHNMFIMKRELLDAYCEWLFDVLFQLEARLDLSEYGEGDRPVFSRVAERLLDVWIEANGVKYVETPYWSIEETDNWLSKAAARLKKLLEEKTA